MGEYAKVHSFLNTFFHSLTTSFQDEIRGTGAVGINLENVTHCDITNTYIANMQGMHHCIHAFMLIFYAAASCDNCTSGCTYVSGSNVAGISLANTNITSRSIRPRFSFSSRIFDVSSTLLFITLKQETVGLLLSLLHQHQMAASLLLEGMPLELIATVKAILTEA